MTAFTAKVAAALDAGKALTTTLLNQLWDNTTYAKERLDAHLHDGSDGTQLIPVQPNYFRNGSFELGVSGYTQTVYSAGATLGSISVNTANPLNGNTSLAFTSANLAAGAGDIVSNELIPVTGLNAYQINLAVQAVSAITSASFTATIATTNMTVTGSPAGYLIAGQTIAGTGVTAGTKIISQTSGTTGAAGVYVVGISQTVASATAMTASHSISGVSAKMEVQWYDKTAIPSNLATGLISASTVWSSSSTPSAVSYVGSVQTAPLNARFMRTKFTGCVPGVGTQIGTVYVDGMVSTIPPQNTIFDKPGTYTFVMPVDAVYIAVQGAGAGSNASGFPGSSGAYGEGWVYAPKGTSITITVGAGGIYNTSGGGTSSFGTYLSCTGGTVGSGAAGGVVTPAAATVPSMGVGFTILLNGIAGAGVYNAGSNGYYKNTGGASSLSPNGILGGGGIWNGQGGGGDGFVSVRW
jgi:hypothetical protein